MQPMNRKFCESSFKCLSWPGLAGRIAVAAMAGKKALVLLLASATVLTVSAQDQTQLNDDNIDIGDDQGFGLFEDVETAANNTAQSRSRAGRAARENRATIANPEFTLIGTTRIGNSYSAIVQHKDGDTLVVKTSPDSNTVIPGHTGYTIVTVGPGSASIRYPDNNPCAEFPDKGVKCNSAANIAALSLTTGEPLPTGANQPDSSQLVSEDAVPVNPDNPFEALRAAQVEDGAAADNPASGNRFSPRRIDPADVPPGMRVVSTPFGDRLVEQ